MTEFTTRKQIAGKRVWYRDHYTDKTAYETICSAKSRLLLNHPFWGFMGLDLVLVEAPSSEIPTLATDGYHIFYSAKFVNSLRMGEVEFGVAHEIYHCIFGHTGGQGLVNRRREDWDARLWNKACDYVINYDLKQAGVGEFITTIKILYDERYAGMGAEEVYLLLEQHDPQPDVETLDVHVDFEITDADTAGADDGSEPADCDGNGSGNADKAKGGSGKGRSITIRVTQGELEQEALRWQQTAQRAVAQAQQGGNDAGSIPAHLLRLIQGLNAPKIHWTSALRKFVVNIRAICYSFTRPDRRTFGGAYILPSRRNESEKLVIAVAIDTSGSIGDEILGRFMSELLGIVKAFRSYEVHVFCFEGDVDSRTYSKIVNDGSDAKKQLMDYVQKVAGGGGTNFQSIWDFIRLKKITPRGLVVFTDGYANDDTWHYERGIPALFITTGNPGWQAPFGRTIPFENL
jgi:predicted metal-dependent peptidase